MEESQNNKVNIQLDKRWLVAIAVCISAFATNPSLEKHKSAVKTEVSSLMQKEMAKSEDSEATGFENLGMAFGSIMLNSMIDNAVSVNDFLLFSTTKISYKGDSRIVGLGMFGNVFLFKSALNPEEILKEKP